MSWPSDNPLGRQDLSLLKRHFPTTRYEIRNVLDAAAFGNESINGAAGQIVACQSLLGEAHALATQG